MSGSYAERFQEYFSRDVAEKAARSLSNGAEMEFRIESLSAAPEVFTFRRVSGRNSVVSGAASDPQVAFELTPGAAETILSSPADSDIGAIGVGIARLILSKDPGQKVRFRLNGGLLSLLTKGYFGVVASGGSGFASFLASKGLGGIGAIKNAVKKLRT